MTEQCRPELHNDQFLLKWKALCIFHEIDLLGITVEKEQIQLKIEESIRGLEPFKGSEVFDR